MEKNNEDIISQKILECVRRQINENSLEKFKAYVDKIENYISPRECLVEFQINGQ